MAATAASSSSAADSYIGSVISLTSKSEIRYEGVLFRINPEESSIGLRNVRSFGTEGRKKDGPQIPPSDKVYEHILFRGTDIKDLQVISSPPMQPAHPINNDPAIIQSHYSCPATASVTFPSSASGSLIDHNSYTSQHGLLGSTNFQGAMPLYQPGGNLDPWGASPAPPNANGVGLAMPMYWQGYYSVQNGLPHLHQQTLLTPPTGLALPSSMQQQMQYPNFSPHFSTGASNLTEAPSSLLPTPTTSSLPHVVSTSLLASTIAPILPPVPSVTLASDMLKSSTPSKAPNFSRPASIQTAALPSLASLTTSTGDVNNMVELVPNRSVPNVVGASNASSTVSTAPPLFTSALPQLRPAVLASISQSSQTPHKDVEVQVPSSPEPSMADSTKSQPPTLGLPVPASFGTSIADVNHEIPAASIKSTPSVVGKISALTTGSSYVTSGGQQLVSYSQSSQTPQKDVEVVQSNGASIKTHGHRGRGRGWGLVGARTMTKFTEDFDFMAMNEKFKKEEVWGHLGKNSKSHGKEERDGSFSDEEDSHNGENAEASKIEPKPVYKKDDFFDTLSCTALNIESQNGRTRYSEQLKIDTETFGDFLKYPGGRGGRGPGRGGRSRGGGGYRGRGHGGRGRSTRVA